MRVHCALLLCAASGCVSPETEAAAREPDTAGRRDSIAAVAAASMSEQQVIGLLLQTHATDSALGALGAANGSTLEIKDFGRMITREHIALARDARQLGEGLRITPERPVVAADEAPAAIREMLAAAGQGSTWDRVYVDYMIAAHHAAMENTARALAATRSPATRDYIRKSVPILQKHLDKASSLQRALSRSQAAAPAPQR